MIRVGVPAGAVLEFSVAADGRVDYPRAYERALSGRGTARLTVDLDTAARQ